MSNLQATLAIVRQHRRAFITMCALLYGGMALTMAAAMIAPPLKPWASSWYDVNNFAHLPYFQSVFAAYAEGELLKAAALTFFFNCTVALVLTTIPSLIIPFIGILAVYYRGWLLGAMYAPFGAALATFVPHMPTVIIECFAYLLAGFGAYVHGVMVLNPQRYGCATRREAYMKGLGVIARLWVWILLILLVIGLYEGFEVIYIVPLFVSALAG
jgi:hypothetical protein